MTGPEDLRLSIIQLEVCYLGRIRSNYQDFAPVHCSFSVTFFLILFLEVKRRQRNWILSLLSDGGSL